MKTFPPQLYLISDSLVKISFLRVFLSVVSLVLVTLLVLVMSGSGHLAQRGAANQKRASEKLQVLVLDSGCTHCGPVQCKYGLYLNMNHEHLF